MGHNAVTLFCVCLLLAFPITLAKVQAVHAFYYLWYGSEAVDGQFRHWNHKTLPHWNAEVRKRYSELTYQPPELIHAPYYPLRGCYSSRNASLLRDHFLDMKAHHITTAVVSWWGRPEVPGTHDSQGVGTDDVLPMVFDAAASAGITIALHLEPYHGRSAESIRLDIEYLLERYGDHTAMLRMPRELEGVSRALPVLYVYDSYHIVPGEWQRLLSVGGDLSIRHTASDAFLIGLWLDSQHGQDLVHGGFDGMYTYFASDGFSYGATTRHWKLMARFAHEHGKLFVPSVGPGYDDTRIRPWNRSNKKDREGGSYYERMLQAAEATNPTIVAITSYNEWGEGTQIEAAVPHTADASQVTLDVEAFERQLGCSLQSEDYSPQPPHFYLQLTRQWIEMQWTTGTATEDGDDEEL